jgi:hypothetical protein
MMGVIVEWQIGEHGESMWKRCSVMAGITTTPGYYCTISAPLHLFHPHHPCPAPTWALPPNGWGKDRRGGTCGCACHGMGDPRYHTRRMYSYTTHL